MAGRGEGREAAAEPGARTVPLPSPGHLLVSRGPSASAGTQ